MRSPVPALAIAALLTSVSGDPGEMTGAAERLEGHYKHGAVTRDDRAPEAGKQWKPTSSDVAAAKQLLSQKKSLNVTRAAAAYCLAMAGDDPEGNTARMVSFAMRTIGAGPEREDAVTGLGDALYAVIIKTKARAALRALATLDLDGAPGECMWDVQIEVFSHYPGELANEWARLTAKRKPVLPGILAASMDPHGPDITNELRAAARSKNANVRALARASLRSARAGF